jgi:uncharacterized membrane protein (GlpM family)
MAALPTTLVFLITFYLLVGKVPLALGLFLSTFAWCASAGVAVLINHYILRIGY